MAGDWIKVEVSLPDKPEVWEIAGILAIDPDAVVGKLLKVWRWFDAHTESGNASGVTFALVDSKAGVTGFAEAMNFVGWLTQEGRELRLPNFDRHNGKTAKNRALTAKRVASHKDKSNAEANAAIVSDALPREEKRREENKEHKTPVAKAPVTVKPDGVTDATWADFQQHRKAKKAAITDTALAGIKREAGKAGWSMEDALAECCLRGWVGFNAEWVARRGSATMAEQIGNGRRAL